MMLNITVANAKWNYDVCAVDDNGFDCAYRRAKHHFDYPASKRERAHSSAGSSDGAVDLHDSRWTHRSSTDLEVRCSTRARCTELD